MKLEVWSDVVCPWCWLGKARLDKALEAFPHPESVEIVYRSFELDPRTPKELDVSTHEILAKKYGMGPAQIDAIHERLRGLGQAEGLDFHFDRTRTSNTFEAHQLVHLARSKGKEDQMVDTLFRANFRDGVRVGERTALSRLAGEVGLDPAEVDAALASQRFAPAVREDEMRARSLGISGVPFFLVDGQLAVSGAQPVEVLRQLLEKGWAGAPT